jgi:hypothetical protein
LDDAEATIVDWLGEGQEPETERLGDGGEALEKREGGAVIVGEGSPAREQRGHQGVDMARLRGAGGEGGG